ncbi:hypothetical protein Cfor_01647 [Coptotermes formosanus]|uniref:Tc1-like transposase DDE domain-containing protein n=1 Tax=Coptotermes formosanus TaxID=36987 RepID=A0A6L2Q3Q6_COPFO|nr:hypothetical protein Cfor_01647 [Coptotermes formosanus]
MDRRTPTVTGCLHGPVETQQCAVCANLASWQSRGTTIDCSPDRLSRTGSANRWIATVGYNNQRIRRIRPQYSAPGSWFLLHDNAPVHRPVAVQEFLARKQVCVLNHPPYSPDLSPCDYFLFPKMKLPLKGRLFEDVQDIQGAVTSSLRAILQEDVQRSFQSLLDRATRYIDAEGMYFE